MRSTAEIFDLSIYDRFNNWLRKNGPTIILGGFIGIAITVAIFYLRPVVTMQGELLSQTSASANIHVWGKKSRGSCKFLEINTYASKGGVLYDTISSRIDMESDGLTKPEGVFDIGNWLIYPTDGAQSVLMYVTHSCGPGDVRVTKIADVKLKPIEDIIPR